MQYAPCKLSCCQECGKAFNAVSGRRQDPQILYCSCSRTTQHKAALRQRTIDFPCLQSCGAHLRPCCVLHRATRCCRLRLWRLSRRAIGLPPSCRSRKSLNTGSRRSRAPSHSSCAAPCSGTGPATLVGCLICAGPDAHMAGSMRHLLQEKAICAHDMELPATVGSSMAAPLRTAPPYSCLLHAVSGSMQQLSVCQLLHGLGQGRSSHEHPLKELLICRAWRPDVSPHAGR